MDRRRLLVLSMALSVGLLSNLSAQIISMSEDCIALFSPDGVFAEFNAETVSIAQTPVHTPGSDPVRFQGQETFCTESDSRDDCPRVGFWSAGVGDDMPLNNGTDCDYELGPGAFGVGTTADWTNGSEYCLVFNNLDNNAVNVRMIMYSSFGDSGIALQVRDAIQSESEWIDPGKSSTVCLDFSSAQIEVDGGFVTGPVPRLQFVTAFGVEVGALTPNTENRGACLDGNKDNNPPDCRNNPPAGPGLNRQSDNIDITVEQPRPLISVSPSGLGFCNGGVLNLSVSNSVQVDGDTVNGTGTLIVTDVDISGSGSADFEVLNVGLEVPPGASRNLRVRFNPRENGMSTATLKVFSNAIDPADNRPVDAAGGQPTPEVDLAGFATVNQKLRVRQDSATDFSVFVDLHIAEDAPTGFQGEDSGLIPDGCAQVTEITEIASRLEFDQDQVQAIGTNIGRVPPPAVSGTPILDPGFAPVPCCEVDRSDPDNPQNEKTFWDVQHDNVFESNLIGRLDIQAYDLGGTVIDTQAYIDEFAASDVVVEAYSAQFVLEAVTGCTATQVEFTTGPDNNFFPDGSESHIVLNPTGGGLPQIQDVGANSRRDFGIPENSLILGDVDFSAQVDANDILREAEIVAMATTEAEIVAILGRNCPAAADVDQDMDVDVLDLLALLQVQFGSGSVQPTDFPRLNRLPGNQNDSQPSDVVFPNPGYVPKIQNNKGNWVVDDPNKFQCPDGLDCT